MKREIKSALAATVLCLIVVLRFRATLFARSPGPDEAVYDHAFALLRDGRSPYDEARFYYLPAFARLGAFTLGHVGLVATRIGLRLLNLAGAGFVAWESTLGLRRRAVVAAALVCLGPPLVSSIEGGNPSALAVALAIGAFRWRGKPWLSGLLMAVSVLVKPVAVLGLLALPPVAAVSAMLLIAFSLVLDPASTAALIRRGDATASGFANGSLRHVLELLGVRVSSAVVTIVVAIVAFVLIRRLRRDADTIALTASLFAIPLVWTHSFVLLLPTVVAVVAHSVAEARGARHERSRERVRLAIVVFGVVVLGTADLWRGFIELAPPLQAVLTSIPLVVSIAFTALRIKFGPLTARTVRENELSRYVRPSAGVL